MGALQVIALLRYDGEVEWSRPGAWLYVLFLVGILVGGIHSTMAVWRLDLQDDAQAVRASRKT